MYDLNDTIVAVSSATSDARVIVRITGPETIKVCRQIFHPQAALEAATQRRSAVVAGDVCVGVDPAWAGRGSAAGGPPCRNRAGTQSAELRIDAKLYLFVAPHSYTGDYLAEIHIHTNSSVTGVLMSHLLGIRHGRIRMAGPGEFTARAYLNGKIDLAQAEAVNEIVVSSNTFQLAAAEKLLSGRLAESTEKVRAEMMDCLSLIEAGLDFSGEDIEFISRREAAERLAEIRGALESALGGPWADESVIDLPAVGIAGAPNAGKSSLLNKLLGTDRSIVSAERKTTRDVLTGLLTLDYCRCVLFDCAGLTSSCVMRDASCEKCDTQDAIRNTEAILDELAHEAAIEALRNSSVVVFCVDISKPDWSEDLDARSQIVDARRGSRIEHPASSLIPVATKSDLLFRHGRTALAQRLTELNGLFASEFLAISAKTGYGIGLFRETIDRKILDTGYSILDTRSSIIEHQATSVDLTARHIQVVTEAIENVKECIDEFRAGHDEVAAMMLRAAYQSISGIESADRRIDEQILEKIFSRFCIGK